MMVNVVYPVAGLSVDVKDIFYEPTKIGKYCCSCFYLSQKSPTLLSAAPLPNSRLHNFNNLMLRHYEEGEDDGMTMMMRIHLRGSRGLSV